jgi:hypothetical protein
MVLRLIVYAAGALLGMVILYAGVRLLAGGIRDRTGGAGTPPQATGPPSFPTSGAVFVAAGALMIALAIKMTADLQHEIMTAVSPLSYLNLDAPPAPPEDNKPPTP